MKFEVPEKLQNLEEVNRALGEIGSLECALEAVAVEEQQLVSGAKKQAEKRSAPLREKIACYEKRVETFARENPDLFAEKKSRSLAFGVFGFRRSVSVNVSPRTVQLLKKFRLDKYVRVTIKEDPRKELLKELDDASLARVEASRMTEDKFFIKADREDANKELKEAG